MPRRRKAYSRSTALEEEEEAMDEEAVAEDEDDEVEDGDEDGEDEEDEGGSKGSRGQGGSRERPGQRNAANARERARMRVLSRAFCRLKTTLPWVPPDTKLSKLDTLRLATSYIAHLRAMLAAEAESVATVEAKGAPVGGESPDRGRVSTLHPLNLTWPFSFQRTSSSSSTSPASSTSSNVSASMTSGQTGITALGDEWSSVHGMQSNHYCQENHLTMDSRGSQSHISPSSQHHILHHHHPHHFLPSSYPDSSLLHIA